MTQKQVIISFDTTTCKNYHTDNVCALLKREFDGSFPTTARIYHERPVKDNDVTPTDEAGIERLQSLEGVFYVVVYPGETITAGAAAWYVAVFVASLVVQYLTRPDDPEKKISNKIPTATGSPNNKLGDRQNSVRVNGRVPDIFGAVRSTPDAIAESYTTFVGHRENSVSLLCITAGTATVSDAREAETLAADIGGMSVGIYEPGNFPTGVEGTSTRSLQIGEFIDDPVFVTDQIKAVNGQIAQPANHFTLLGDVPDPVPVTFNELGVWSKMVFSRDSPTVGRISVLRDLDYMQARFAVGDIITLIFPAEAAGSPSSMDKTFTPFAEGLKAMPIGKVQDWVTIQDGTGPLPVLGGTYTVLSVESNSVDSGSAITIDITAQAAEWTRISVYSVGLTGDPVRFADLGPYVINGRARIDVPEKEWLGPFFVENVEAPTGQGGVRQVLCNFVAQNGLYAEDGKTQARFNVEFEIEVTPADDTGLPLGTPIDPAYALPTDQSETVLPAADENDPEDVNKLARTVIGSINSRVTRANTVRFAPSFKGKFVIRARRLTRTPWRDDAPSQFGGITPTINNVTTDAISERVLFSTGNPNASVRVAPSLLFNEGVVFPENPGVEARKRGLIDTRDSSYLVFKGNVQDEVRWTHCYVQTTVPVEDFSNAETTIAHVRTVESEGAIQTGVRRFSCLARRRIQTWDGFTFGGPLVESSFAEDILFHILKDPNIGNLDDTKIDFPGIAAAFEEVRDYFGGADDADGFGGDAAGRFNYTFDDDSTTLEQTINAICQACFCIPFREADVVKVRSDLASSASVLLCGHRNILPGTQTRALKFGTDADFDGVRVDFTETTLVDPNNDAIRTYSIPDDDSALNVRELEIPGIRTKRHAAWHAWRAYNRLLFQKLTIQFEMTEEAAYLTLFSKFQAADTTRSDTQDGEIVGFSGGNLLTSQDVSVTPLDYTVFLVHPDETVEAIIITSAPSSREIALASPPSGSIVVAPALGVPTIYHIVKNDDTRAREFNVVEKDLQDNGVYSIVATNSSPAFYGNDGLQSWLPFLASDGAVLNDHSPYENRLVTTNVTVGADPTRGTVYVAAGPGSRVEYDDIAFDGAARYSKACWVFCVAGSEKAIYGSNEANFESLVVSASNAFQAGHGTVHVNGPVFPANTWTHVGVTYDPTLQLMILYMDGIEVDRATLVPQRILAGLVAFSQFSGVNDFIGRADDLRYWMRVLSADEMKELFFKTRRF